MAKALGWGRLAESSQAPLAGLITSAEEQVDAHEQVQQRGGHHTISGLVSAKASSSSIERPPIRGRG